MKKILRLGSRGSPLALLQAEEVRKKLLATWHTDAFERDIEIVPIRTGGDWRPEQKDVTFRDIGGSKELFTKEIEEALLGGHIDLAVHSMKDVSSYMPKGLTIGALLERIDPRDAFIGRSVKSLEELPPGASVGTSSLRRQAQILAKRPDLKVVPLRGNVETRIKRLNDEEKADATILAMAGLLRLGLHDLASSVMSTEVMLPAAAQGAIGVEARATDIDVLALLRPIHHAETALCIGAERALLRALDGSCHTPIGAYAHMTAPDQLTLDAMAARPNGTGQIRMRISCDPHAGEDQGRELGETMRRRLPADFYASL